MKKVLIIFCIMLFIRAEVSLWDEETSYTVINATNEPLEVAWQSGGGPASTLTGKRDSFSLGALQRYTIKTINKDCLDEIMVRSVTTEKTALATNVCKKEITIEYIGDLKNQTLVLRLK